MKTFVRRNTGFNSVLGGSKCIQKLFDLSRDPHGFHVRRRGLRPVDGAQRYSILWPYANPYDLVHAYNYSPVANANAIIKANSKANSDSDSKEELGFIVHSVEVFYPSIHTWHSTRRAIAEACASSILIDSSFDLPPTAKHCLEDHCVRVAASLIRHLKGDPTQEQLDHLRDHVFVVVCAQLIIECVSRGCGVFGDGVRNEFRAMTTGSPEPKGCVPVFDLPFVRFASLGSWDDLLPLPADEIATFLVELPEFLKTLKGAGDGSPAGDYEAREARWREKVGEQKAEQKKKKKKSKKATAKKMDTNNGGVGGNGAKPDGSQLSAPNDQWINGASGQKDGNGKNVTRKKKKKKTRKKKKSQALLAAEKKKAELDRRQALLDEQKKLTALTRQNTERDRILALEEESAQKSADTAGERVVSDVEQMQGWNGTAVSSLTHKMNQYSVVDGKVRM